MTQNRSHHGVAGRHLRALLFATLAVSLTGCAGSTFRSGVGDTFLEGPPYYAGMFVAPGGTIAHLPVTFQRGATQPAFFEPSGAEDRAVGRLLDEMNEWLDGLGVTARIDGRPSGTAPDVLFGCERPGDDDCEDADRRRPHRLAVTRPSRSWIDWSTAQAAGLGADRILVITLEVGNYMPRQRDWRGSKEIRLGTGYAVDLPWLTSLDKPVSVLQLTGVLMDASGRAIRIGAEGLIARRTPLLIAAINGQSLISEEDARRALTATRDDLPGRPLVWQVALNNLVAQLTGTPGVALR